MKKNIFCASTLVCMLMLLIPSAQGNADQSTYMKLQINECKKFGNNSLGNPIRFEDSGHVEDWNKLLKPVGNLKAIIVPIDTPDNLHTSKISDLELFASNLSSEFSRLSFGKLNLTVDVLDSWITLPNSGIDYETKIDWWVKINDAISSSDDLVDFSKYDLALFKHDEKSSSVTSAGALPMWEKNLPDGLKVLRGAYIGRDHWVSIGLGVSEMIHEILHVFGLPDLYMLNPNGTVPVGIFDVMSTFNKAYKPFVLNWHAWKLGWLEDSDVLCASPQVAQLFMIERSDEKSFIVIPEGANRVNVIEVWKQNLSSIPKVLFYSVDSKAYVWTSRLPAGKVSPIQMLRPMKRPIAPKLMGDLNLDAAFNPGDETTIGTVRIKYVQYLNNSAVITYTPTGQTEIKVPRSALQKKCTNSTNMKIKIVDSLKNCPKGYKAKIR